MNTAKIKLTSFAGAGPLFWPTFVVAILAAIIASQAMFYFLWCICHPFKGTVAWLSSQGSSDPHLKKVCGGRFTSLR
jgi:hypothetical protein